MEIGVEPTKYQGDVSKCSSRHSHRLQDVLGNVVNVHGCIVPSFDNEIHSVYDYYFS